MISGPRMMARSRWSESFRQCLDHHDLFVATARAGRAPAAGELAFVRRETVARARAASCKHCFDAAGWRRADERDRFDWPAQRPKALGTRHATAFEPVNARSFNKRMFLTSFFYRYLKANQAGESIRAQARAPASVPACERPAAQLLTAFTSQGSCRKTARAL
jgi:hypothetical protein